MFSTGFQRSSHRTREAFCLHVGLSLSLVFVSGCGAYVTSDSGGQQSGSVDAGVVQNSIEVGDAEADIDLGIIDPHESSAVRFRLVNRTAEEIQIDSVKTSCGCLKADDYPERLQPSAQGEITLSVDSRRPPGRFDQSLHVFGETRSGNEWETRVRLRGFVRGILLEQTHVRMGVVTKGHQVAVSGIVIGHPESVEVRVSQPEMLDVVETSIDPAGESPLRPFYVRLAVKGTEEAQPIHEQLDVKVVAATATYSSPVLVTGLIGGSIRVTPSALVFNLRSASRGKDNLTLTVATLNRQETIRDLELAFNRDLFHVAVEAQTPNEIRYRISVNASAVLKPYTGAIDVVDAGRLSGRVSVVVVP